MKKSKTVALVTLLALLLIIAVQMYVLNIQTPLCRDDYSYSYTFAVTEGKYKISNIKDVIESQINHYKVLNGRVITHTICQSFLIFDKSVFNVFNTVAFVLLVVLITFHSTKKLDSKALLTALFAFLCLWYFTPAFGDSFLWLTGACNYLWGILIIYSYLLVQNKAIEGYTPHKGALNILIYPVYFIFAFITGATNENTGAALLVMSVTVALISIIKHKRVYALSIVGFWGNFSGFLFMILAPGQSVRLENNGGMGNFDLWLKRIGYISRDFYKYHKILMLAFALLLVIAIIKKVKIEKLFVPIVFFTGTLASVYSMILSPYFPERAWCGPTVLFVTTVLSLACALLPDIRKRYIVGLVGVACAILGYAFAEDYKIAYADVTAINQAVTEREALIDEAKAQGITTVELEPIKDNSRFTPYVDFDDLNNNPDNWPNTALAMYYELDKVIKKSHE